MITGINWGSITQYLDPHDSGLSGATLDITDSAGNVANVRGVTDGAIVDFGDLNGDGCTDLVVGATSSIYLKFYVAYAPGPTATPSAGK
jgi:hypothetical protein